jgi:hypothetical protein
MPCPNGVAIPEIFSLTNEYWAGDRNASIKQKYKDTLTPGQYSKNCIKCGICEEACPQHLPIRELLRGSGQTFES